MTPNDPLVTMSRLQSRLERLTQGSPQDTLQEWQTLKADIDRTCQELLRVDPTSAHDYLPLLSGMISQLDLLIAERTDQKK